MLITILLAFEPWATYFENVIGFYACVMFTVSMLALVIMNNEDDDKKSIVGERRSKLHTTYMVTSTLVEIAVFAALGWYFVATFWTFNLLAAVKMHDESRKIAVN